MFIANFDAAMIFDLSAVPVPCILRHVVASDVELDIKNLDPVRSVMFVYPRRETHVVGIPYEQLIQKINDPTYMNF